MKHALVGLVAVAAIAGTMALGFWQVRRGDAKEAARERIERAAHATPEVPSAAAWADAGALVGRHVALSGTWMPDRVIYLDNRPQRGASGVHVLMALRVDGRLVVVNRGWLPHDPRDRTRIAPYRTDAGLVTIDGIALADEQRLLELGRPAAPALGGLWQNFDRAAFERLVGEPVAPVVVRQDRGGVGDGLDRDWSDRGDALQGQIDRHRGYAFQWFALAATLAVLVVVHFFRSYRLSRALQH